MIGGPIIFREASAADMPSISRVRTSVVENLLTLDQLDERERVVVRLRFVEDLSQTQIAARIGVSQMQVSRLLRRALERLRTSPAAIGCHE